LTVGVTRVFKLPGDRLPNTAAAPDGRREVSGRE